MPIPRYSAVSLTRRNHRGLTMIETLVSVVIAGVSTASLFFPLTAAALMQRQERILGEARNLARLEMENIRTTWSTGSSSVDAAYKTAVRVPIDVAAWPGASQTVLALGPDTDLRDMTSGAAEVAPANVPSSGSVTTLSGIKGGTVTIPRGPASSPNFATDYVAQILVGASPGVSTAGSSPKARRVVVRIFAARNNNSVLTIDTSANAATQNKRSTGSFTSDGGVSSNALHTRALAILISDVAAP